MKALNQNEMNNISGGCNCYCTIERGRYGAGGWISEGFERRFIGQSADALQCTQACRLQSVLCTGSVCS